MMLRSKLVLLTLFVLTLTGCTTVKNLIFGAPEEPEETVPPPLSVGANKIAFLDASGRFWLVTPDGKNRTMLFFDPNLAGKEDFHFDWSPDGTKIITEGLKLIDLETGVITDYPAGDTPKWSPAGDWLLITGPGFEAKELHLLRADGSEARLVDRGDIVLDWGVNHSNPWSPEGDRFVYSKLDETSGEYELWEANVNDDQKRKILAPDEFAMRAIRFATWLPLSNQIAFTYYSLVPQEVPLKWPDPLEGLNPSIAATRAYKNNLPQRAIDGNSSTGWVCPSPRCWIQITFPQPVNLNYLLLNPVSKGGFVRLSVLAGTSADSLSEVGFFEGPAQQGKDIEIVFNQSILTKVLFISGNFGSEWMGFYEIGPDFSENLYEVRIPEAANLALLKVETGKVRVLTNFHDSDQSVLYPLLMPNEAVIAWLADSVDERKGGVWTMALDTEAITRIFANSPTQKIVPQPLSWSADFNYLTAVLERRDQPFGPPKMELHKLVWNGSAAPALISEGKVTAQWSPL